MEELAGASGVFGIAEVYGVGSRRGGFGGGLEDFWIDFGGDAEAEGAFSCVVLLSRLATGIRERTQSKTHIDHIDYPLRLFCLTPTMSSYIDISLGDKGVAWGYRFFFQAVLQLLATRLDQMFATRAEVTLSYGS